VQPRPHAYHWVWPQGRTHLLPRRDLVRIFRPEISRRLESARLHNRSCARIGLWEKPPKTLANRGPTRRVYHLLLSPLVVTGLLTMRGRRYCSSGIRANWPVLGSGIKAGISNPQPPSSRSPHLQPPRLAPARLLRTLPRPPQLRHRIGAQTRRRPCPCMLAWGTSLGDQGSPVRAVCSRS
jgi:hypothetical protein